jgi:GntR family transcriptional regulator/MocR family aminotransferase
MDIPGTLRQRFGHKDLGIYLVARTSGKVVAGDDVQAPDVQPSLPTPSAAPAGLGFICRGCYYVHVASALGDGFHCPDCGTHEGNFRPYQDEPPAAPADSPP